METIDPSALWRTIRDEALQEATARPAMARYFDTCVLGHATLGATLAAHATILGNIEIGAGAVIAAGSVVRESAPPGMIAAGVPAKVVKAAGASYASITAPASREDSR